MKCKECHNNFDKNDLNNDQLCYTCFCDLNGLHDTEIDLMRLRDMEL